MDYHAIHGHDIASFDTSSSTHRLPTVPASQAWEDLKAGPATHISTGLEALDRALLGIDSVDSQDAALQGGVKRGQVTEIWGPPGCGKTALGIQLAANALSGGNGVVWVDCFQKLQTQRIANVLKSVKESRHSAETGDPQEIDPSKLVQYSCMTLPHLLAFISRPTTTTIAADVSLIIISSPSALINSSLPRSLERKGNPKQAKGPTQASKRLQGLQFIINTLQKLAATKNCAVVLLSQCATKMRSEQKPTLIPSINTTVWEQGVSTRLVLFRDWAWNGNKSSSVFLAGLQKIDGRVVQDAVEHVSAFKVEPVRYIDYTQAPAFENANLNLDRSAYQVSTTKSVIRAWRWRQWHPVQRGNWGRRSWRCRIATMMKTTAGQTRTKMHCRRRRLNGKAART
ncbi:RECA_2 domain-containing protein [Trichoderma simmonsii]|uniref:DNA repair protein RAD51 homolog 3 n=1 Tax=Trichoderma simmonsii TaxID=1491479 RepID=A0A8G0PBX6_9HYPO|nr:RECA_2 domain-containing protein [Trichoderma simmonsii]